MNEHGLELPVTELLEFIEVRGCCIHCKMPEHVASLCLMLYLCTAEQCTAQT